MILVLISMTGQDMHIKDYLVECVTCVPAATSLSSVLKEGSLESSSVTATIVNSKMLVNGWKEREREKERER